MTRLPDLPIRELAERVGSFRQLARADLLEVSEGAARGSRLVQLGTAGGFQIEVLPDRGLDLGGVSWRGIPLAWVSAVELVAPTRLDPGDGFLGGFGGGLLTTCGLDQFGDATEDLGRPLPKHGRYHSLSADHVGTWSEARGDAWSVGVRGTVRQSSAFGENLRLERRIETVLGSDEIAISDVVTNDDFHETPHMVLYHVNLGWPIVSEHSTIAVIPDLAAPDVHGGAPTPRDPASAAALDRWSTFEAPAVGSGEEVFVRPLTPGAGTRATVTNPELGLRFSVEFSSAELPWLFQWKNADAGRYVLGIEPGNSSGIRGRAAAREAGDLVILAPGESRSYTVRLRVEETG